jgi:uncharacterized membrane protein
MEALLAALHVVGAVFIVGPMAILPMTGMRAIRAGQGGQVTVLARSTFVFSLLSLLVVVLGFGILGVTTHDTKVTTPWVLSSLVLYAIAFALSVFGVVPALRSAAERLTATPVAPAAIPAHAAVDTKGTYSRVAMLSGSASLLLVAIVVLMSWKP